MKSNKLATATGFKTAFLPARRSVDVLGIQGRNAFARRRDSFAAPRPSEKNPAVYRVSGLVQSALLTSARYISVCILGTLAVLFFFTGFSSFYSQLVSKHAIS